MSPRVHGIVVGSLIVGLLALAPAAASAFTATLSIPGLCAAPINVLLFSVEASNTTTVGSAGGGAGSGKATLKPLVITKLPDDCTPQLFRAVFLGNHVPTATLQVTGGGKAPVSFTIQLNTVVVTNLKHDFAKGGGAADDVLLESVSLIGGSLTFTSGGGGSTCSPETNTCN